MYRQFARIFETFRISEPEKSDDASKGLLQKEPIKELELKKVPKLEDEYEEEEEEEEVMSELDVKEKKEPTRCSCCCCCCCCW
jgi:ribosome-binding factor A